MSRVLLISRSRKFESRLRGLLDNELDTIMGRSLAQGASVAISGLSLDDAPDVAMIGPSLSYAQAYELSSTLSARYPSTSIMLVRETGPGIEKWMTDMKVHAVASPNLDDSALIEAVAGLRDRLHSEGKSRDARAHAEPTPSVVPVEPLHVAAPDGHDDHAPVGSFVEERDAVSEEFPDVSEEFPDTQADADRGTGEPAGAVVSQIIAVVSPKGGMGKTTVATNIAVGLAKIAPMSVVLIDGDVQFGDVAAALALAPLTTLPDAVSDAAASDAIVLKTYLTVHPAGFYVICGAASPVDGDRVTGDQLGDLIARLSGEFRYVVIDTAPGLGEHTLAAIERSTDVVLICGMSVTSARGLRSHLSALDSIKILPTARHVVLNFADRDSGLTVRDVESITGVPVDVAIPRSRRLVLSMNRGIPVLEDRTKDSVTRALAAIVRRFDPSAPPKRRRLHRRTVV